MSDTILFFFLLGAFIGYVAMGEYLRHRESKAFLRRLRELRGIGEDE